MDDRHIGILFPVFDFGLIFVIGVLFCIGLTNFVKIELPSAESWRHMDFSRWRPAAIFHMIWVILVHWRSAIVGLSLAFKFGRDRIYSLGDIAIFIFQRFGLKLLIHGHFWRFWGIFPQMTSPIVLTPKGTSLRGDASFELWAIKRENWFSGSTLARGRGKKDRTWQSKSHKVVIFRIFWEKPHCAD